MTSLSLKLSCWYRNCSAESLGLVTTGVASRAIGHAMALLASPMRVSSISSTMNSSTVRLNCDDCPYLCARPHAEFSSPCRHCWRACCDREEFNSYRQLI